MGHGGRWSILDQSVPIAPYIGPKGKCADYDWFLGAKRFSDRMAGESDAPSQLPKLVRRVPADLAVVILLVFLTDVIVLAPGVRETPLRIVFGLPLVLFLPGYAFIAALFPEQGQTPPPAEDQSTQAKGIDGIERVALSFGLSIALVPLLGLLLNFTPWGIRLVPVLVSISAVTVGLCVIAVARRWALPPEERYVVPYTEWIKRARQEAGQSTSGLDTALNIVLILSVVLAIASVSYAVAVPKQGEAFTEFYLLTEDDGELVAAGYPTEFERGTQRPIVIGIGNHEHEPTRYTVVVALQRVQIRNNSTIVQEEDELGRLQTRIDHNETWMRTFHVTPTFSGSRLRLTFLLYRNEPPATPSVQSAYRELHLWITVSNGTATDQNSTTPTSILYEPRTPLAHSPGQSPTNDFSRHR